MGKYSVEDDEPMIVAEPSAAYGNTLQKDEDDMSAWDNAPELWDMNSPEGQAHINMLLKIGLEQIKRGEVVSEEEVDAIIDDILK